MYQFLPECVAGFEIHRNVVFAENHPECSDSPGTCDTTM